MGAKLDADTATKTLIVSLAPDGNDQVDIDATVDVWSDLIEDWESTLALRRFTFPLVAIGGETISSGKLGTTFVLLDPWQIAPYEASHDLNIDGNLFTESALVNLVLPTVGAYTVSVNRNLSTLVEVVESGTSGLTADEAVQLRDMWIRLYGGDFYADPAAGIERILNEVGSPYSTADIYSDDGGTAYDGTAGVARRNPHVKP